MNVDDAFQILQQHLGTSYRQYTSDSAVGKVSMVKRHLSTKRSNGTSRLLDLTGVGVTIQPFNLCGLAL